jgi:hypothetical protein
MHNLDDLLDDVKDETSFLAFANALATDRFDSVAKENASPSPHHGSAANGWENNSIEHFLDGAIAWAKATDVGLSQGLSADNPWRRFAAFLYCGKIYE